MAFIDVQDLAGYLQVEVTEMGWLGEHSVRSAEDAVKGVLGHDPAWVENDEITLSGVGSSVLERLPILIGEPVEIVSVTLDDVLLVADTDYFLDGSVLRRSWPTSWTWPNVWTRGWRNVVVVYSHGWGEIGSEAGDEVPMDIRDAALSYARDVFHAGQVPPPGISGETTPLYGYTVSTATAANATAISRLGNLRASLAHYIPLVAA